MSDFIADYFKDICPYCFGTGRLKAMQSYMTYNAGTIRGPDTWGTCPVCGGTGKRMKDADMDMEQEYYKRRMESANEAYNKALKEI